MIIYMNTTLRCPNCKSVIDSRTSPFLIEEPFKICGKCKKICITKESGTEWELLTLPCKIFIIVAALLGFVFLFLPLSFLTWIFISNKLIWTAICVCWFFISFYFVIWSHYSAIIDSKKRMSRTVYRIILVSLGLLDERNKQVKKRH